MRTKRVLLAGIVLWSCMQAFPVAQDVQTSVVQAIVGPTVDQLLQMQCNRIIKELVLDDATAAQFTATYKKYMTELRQVRNETQPLTPPVAVRQPETKSVPTDAEVERTIQERFAQSRKILDIRERYYALFRKFLSPKQVAHIYKMEKDNLKHINKEIARRQGTVKNKAYTKTGNSCP